jgi:glycosyltransferase involved in cell wall biosynthesis
MKIDFSRWAVVSYKDDSGLGRQATEIFSVLGLGRRIVVPSQHIEGHPISHDYEFPLNIDFSDDQIKATLAGLDGIIYPECNRWHPRLLVNAKRLGIKTVCIPNWEWFDGKDCQWQLCDLLVCHSRFTQEIVAKYGWRNSTLMPPVIDLTRFPPRTITGKARLFVHNAGLVNEDDRKGTRDAILAFRRLKRPDISLLVRIQKAVPLPELDGRIKIEVGNVEDPKELYAAGDVAIQPSKLEGVGYMVIEPLCSGMPVITLDYPPMNEYVLTKELLVRKRWFKRKAFPSHWIKHAHLRLPDHADLARKINWCADNDLTEISRSNQEYVKAHFDGNRQRDLWIAALSQL